MDGHPRSRRLVRAAIRPADCSRFGEDAARLTVQSSGCTIDLECDSFILACRSGVLELTILNVVEARIARWSEASTAILATDGSSLTFRFEGARADAGRFWIVTLGATGDPAEMLRAVLSSESIATLTTPDFRTTIGTSEADVWHFRAFSEACLGLPDTAACELGEATYVGGAGEVKLTSADPHQISITASDGNEISATHTGGHGRGASFYDADADVHHSYWFNGVEGEVAAALAADQAPLTFSLEGIGDFLRECP